MLQALVDEGEATSDSSKPERGEEEEKKRRKKAGNQKRRRLVPTRTEEIAVPFDERLS